MSSHWSGFNHNLIEILVVGMVIRHNWDNKLVAKSIKKLCKHEEKNEIKQRAKVFVFCFYLTFFLSFWSFTIA